MATALLHSVLDLDAALLIQETASRVDYSQSVVQTNNIHLTVNKNL